MTTEFESRLPNSSVRFSLERSRPGQRNANDALSPSPFNHKQSKKPKMSFAAGKRRGNKVRKGVQFTVMVVGQSSCYITSQVHRSSLSDHRYFHLIGASGTGRTTFVNTLCESDVLAHKHSDSPETAHIEEGIRIKPVNVGLYLSLAFYTRTALKVSCRARRGGRPYCPHHRRHARFRR